MYKQSRKLLKVDLLQRSQFLIIFKITSVFILAEAVT